MRIVPNKSLKQAIIDHQKKLATGKITKCECCGQPSKIYTRPIYSTMARHLITAYRTHGTEWFKLSLTIKDKDGTFAKLAYWGLVEEDTRRKEDGGRSGYWRVTSLGMRFVTNNLRVPKYVKTYNAKVIDVLDDQSVNIVEALGKKFNYNELMGR